MKTAIDKILNNFVFGDVNIIEYEINEYPTPEMNLKVYEVEIVVSLGVDMKDVDALSERLDVAFGMLGFESIHSRIHYLEDRDKLLVMIEGKIKVKSE